MKQAFEAEILALCVPSFRNSREGKGAIASPRRGR